MKQIHSPGDSVTRAEAMQRLFAVGAALGPAVAEDLAHQDLTHARIGLIRRLHQAGPMTQRELSEVLGCTPRNVTGLVDAVEASGLAERRRHPTDRRAVQVALTHTGEQAVAAWQAQAMKVGKRLLADLSEAEVAQLSNALAAVLQRLRA